MKIMQNKKGAIPYLIIVIFFIIAIFVVVGITKPLSIVGEGNFEKMEPSISCNSKIDCNSILESQRPIGDTTDFTTRCNNGFCEVLLNVRSSTR